MTANEKTRIPCPHCDREFTVPAHLIGRRLRCPMCREMFVSHAIEETTKKPASVGQNADRAAKRQRISDTSDEATNVHRDTKDAARDAPDMHRDDSSEPKYRVIRPDGVRSKLTGGDRIVEMYREGGISEDSTVTRDDTDFNLPVHDFVKLHSSTTKLPGNAQHSTFVKHPQYAERSDEAMEPKRLSPLSALRKLDDEPIFIIGGLWHLLSFRGMKIPRDDRRATKEYLDYQITWIERYLKVLHFVNVMYAWFLLVGSVLLMWREGGELVIGFVQDGWTVGVRNTTNFMARWLLLVMTLVIAFCILRVLEAICRLIPACLRFWIATSEPPAAKP